MTANDLQAIGIPAREQTKNVFRVDTEHGAVIYYALTDKWQHRGRVEEGNVLAFKAWLKRNHYL